MQVASIWADAWPETPAILSSTRATRMVAAWLWSVGLASWQDGALRYDELRQPAGIHRGSAGSCVAAESGATAH